MSEHDYGRPDTVNELIERMCKRVKELADMPIDDIRQLYPVNCNTAAETVSYCKAYGWSRGMLIADIIDDEFCPEYDVPIPPDECEGWHI